MKPLCASFCKSECLSTSNKSSSKLPSSRKVEKKQGSENPAKLGQATIISRLNFSWINSVLWLGYSKPLVLEDIPTLQSEDEAGLAYKKFSCKWDFIRRDVNSDITKNLLLQALFRVHWKEMIFVGVCALLRTISVVVSPLLLYAFVQYSKNEHRKRLKGLLLVGCLVLIKMIESFSQRHWFFSSRRSGMRMRSAIIMAIYQKQLKLSSLARRRHSTGAIVNYIAVDAYRMVESFYWFHKEWSLVLQLILAIGVLYMVVGVSALPVLVPVSVICYLNVPFARICNKWQSLYKTAQDERLRAMTEALNNMKIIKLQSWEDRFKNVIDLLRDNEHKCLAESQIRQSSQTVLFWICPVIISTVVFVGCLLNKSAPLNAATIFTVLATLRTMSEPMASIPEALSMLIQVKVSLDRLNAFLLDDELGNAESNKLSKNLEQNPDICVKIQEGNFSWEPESAVPEVRDINFEIRRGQKIAVCGQVGAGKSTILCAILGEVSKISGSVNVVGTIAYVSQTPWIQSGTLRDNILFGETMNRTKYEIVIKACVLHKDINSFNHGDLTEIGQRGLNLSGGQKQRIQLARAVYNDADIYILDDPLSAVDVQTASILFKDCFMTALKDKTVILVTHQVEFLKEADKILVIEGGQIIQSGRYMELLTPGTPFEKLVNAHKSAITQLVSSDNGNKGESWNTLEIESELPCESFPPKESTEKDISDEGLPAIQLTKEEEREIGGVGWKPILDYLYISEGMFFFSLSLLSCFAFVALQATASYWLAVAIRIPKISSGILVGVYTGISIFSIPFVYLRKLFAVHLGLKASKAFFSGISSSVFKAPMHFFDSTPMGRIFTRVSLDMSTLDLDLPFAISLSASSTTDLFAIIVVMASVTWPVLIVTIPIIMVANYVQRYYLSSARELIRMNGTTKAPILNFAAEASQGVVSIRAFKMMDMFFQNYLKLVDTDARLFFHCNAATEWLVLRIEALQNLVILTAALLIVLLPGKHVPGFVGLSLSYALTLSSTQVIMTSCHCNLSNNIVSVERIRQFMHIAPEPPAIVKDMRPPASWPSQGKIELEDLKVRYRPNTPLVLKGISCTFKEGSRVGVVGRTGSGKSTLIGTLFRLVEPESGRILIDGLDICSIGLKDLRTRLSIIPQEPTLFRGSLRTNLDPLGIYSDTQIWEALEKCQLKETICSLPMLLDSSVSDEGENWSVGQRQLICLGRVLLKRNRILVLDEATASIDSATDAILQRIIREEFSGCTVITIAHRVPTITDSDMVMVLSDGEMVEYDVPSKLMDSNSAFSKLVSEYWSNNRKNSMQS